MAEVIWSEPALDNLNDIAEYIAINNIIAAQKLVANVFLKVNRLELFPDSGRISEEIPELDYREVVVNPCKIFYKTDGSIVHILNVLRQEMDIRKYIIDQRENG